jgi:putative phosphoesterase
VRLAIISDTHLPRGDRRLPDACVGLMAEADAILHAGDFTRPAVLDALETLGPPVLAVHGNVDEPALRERLPEQRVEAFAGARIAMLHNAGPASGRLKRMRRRFPDADALIFGHSHIPLHERDDADGFQIFNPGSPTDKRRQPVFTMGVAVVEGGAVAIEHVVLD